MHIFPIMRMATSAGVGPLLALGLVTSCFAPDYELGIECALDGWCPPGQTCAPNRRCVLDPAPTDASDGPVDGWDLEPDSNDDTAPPFGGYIPSNFDPTDQLVSDLVVVIDCPSARFDSETFMFLGWCTETTPTQHMSPDGAVILAVKDLIVTEDGVLTLTGSRPVILAVFGDAEISGHINASANGAMPGPGGAGASDNRQAVDYRLKLSPNSTY